MNERVIITLKYGKQEADFDLPGKTKIKDFKEDLKQLLMKKFSGIPLHDSTYVLKHKTNYLSDEYSLYDYGIYDGEKLTIEAVTH